jgi:hypothetical protein
MLCMVASRGITITHVNTIPDRKISKTTVYVSLYKSPYKHSYPLQNLSVNMKMNTYLSKSFNGPVNHT